MLQGSFFPSCGLTQREETDSQSSPTLTSSWRPLHGHRALDSAHVSAGASPISLLLLVVNNPQLIPGSTRQMEKFTSLWWCLSTSSNVRFNHKSPAICVPRLAPESELQVQGSCAQHPFPVVSSGAGGAQLWKQGHFSVLALFLEPVTALPFTATKPGIGV